MSFYYVRISDGEDRDYSIDFWDDASDLIGSACFTLVCAVFLYGWGYVFTHWP